MGAIIGIPIAIATTLLSARPSDIFFWIKWIISYCYIQVFRRINKKRFDLYDFDAEHDAAKLEYISPTEEIILESPLEEFQLQNTTDEILCYGVNSKSERLIVRISRLCNYEAEAWIYLKLSNGKVYQLKETSSYQQSCSESKKFTCGGLQMHYIRPMRVWRIFYHGLLRETEDDNINAAEEMVCVKFALLWRSSSDVFDFTTDVNASTLARGMAKASWRGFLPPLEKVNRALDLYAQSGIIMGTVSVDGKELDSHIYLFGERFRFTGQLSVLKEANIFHFMGQAHKNGALVHLSEISIKNIVENLTLGFVIEPAGYLSIITDMELDLGNISGNRKKGANVKFHIEDDSYTLERKFLSNKNRIIVKNSSENGWTVENIDFMLNSYEGSGIFIKGNNLRFPDRKSAVRLEDALISTIPFVVPFSDKLCQDSNITGGKGSSLGKLTELSKEFKNFTVPKGLVVTTAAYHLFITKDVLKEIRCLEDVLYGNVTGDIKESCKKVMDEIIKSNIPDQVLQSIVNSLHKVFPDKDILKFAVRSSATGEDTEQMSAAGQMDTFLGVSGLREILLTVKKCWASQFSFTAVQYKRQYGQIINTPMAVVIQKMIPCDVAGVLFTCDPVTGNPTTISITANYGLGESVVSASEEPDTIEIKRDEEDRLCMTSTLIGAKNHRITLREGGTNTVEVSEEERKVCCLTDEMALQLGNLAIKIEKSYRSHRDIEWGFWNNSLYIFQSRPVTSGSGETDFEIDHEMDAHMRVEKEYFTVANVGEVMPGAMSPLGLDVVLKYLRFAIQKDVNSQWSSDLQPIYYPKGILSMYNHVMFHLIDLYEQAFVNKDIAESSAMATFGRQVEDNDIVDLAVDRFSYRKKPRFAKIKEIYSYIRLFQSRICLRKALRKYEKYRIPVEKYKTAQEMFNAMMYACSDLNEEVIVHMMNTEASSNWNSYVMNALTKSAGELNSEVYRIFAQLLITSSDVESADVPSTLERLASHIAEEIPPDDFKKMEVKEAIEKLEKSQTIAGIKYREFLIKHGHRCLREFDFRIKPWGTDPSSLIPLLKNLVGSVKKEAIRKKEEDINETLSNLGFPLDFKTRLLLKFLIPQCRKGVQNRELSKSLMIKCGDAWRKGYWKLAQLMVSEGRIPDEDLLFFLNLDEIKELLITRSPKIISKANHRRRRQPILDKHIFPEIMKGFPQPINNDDTVICNDDNFSMTGTPVSPGVTKAFVRVALTLQEAEGIQPGEILVTYSTDIGWSPYFPILAGVVTELGGLISHGAVVSREYGLPCIAGLHGATRQFQTGDFVLLDGNKGILQKLPKPENSDS